MVLTCSLHVPTDPGISRRLRTLSRYFLGLPEMVAPRARLLLIWEMGFLSKQFMSPLSDGIPLEFGGKPAGDQL